MHSFLGVPIMIRGEAWGNLYLTEKRIGGFTEDDEYAAVTLATWAAIAIDHARLLTGTIERQDQLDAAVRRLEATQAVAAAVGAETDLASVLELIAEGGRAIVAARSVLMLLQEGVDLVIASRAGDTQAQTGARLPVANSIFGQVMVSQRAARVDDPASQPGLSPAQLGAPDMRSALLVPLVYRDDAIGLMTAFDRDTGSPGFDDADEQALVAFAASAAPAVGQYRRREQIG
jgi:GAF domain-containing protein